MSIPSFIKGAFIKSALTHLTDGDKGSTLLGGAAAALLAAGVDWSKVLQGFHTQDGAIECGKVAAIVAFAVWGYFTGKKKDNVSN